MRLSFVFGRRPSYRACLLWHSFNKFVRPKRLHEPALFVVQSQSYFRPQEQPAAHMHAYIWMYMCVCICELCLKRNFNSSLSLAAAAAAASDICRCRTWHLALGFELGWAPGQLLLFFFGLPFRVISCDISSVKCQFEFIDNAIEKRCHRVSESERGREECSNYWRINSPAKWPWPLLRNLWKWCDLRIAQSAPHGYKHCPRSASSGGRRVRKLLFITRCSINISASSTHIHTPIHTQVFAVI